MAIPTTPTTPDRRKVYRFALYGRRNSGKTCILASLAMSLERDHPERLTCVWLDEPLVPLAGEEPATLDRNRKWLREAVSSIEGGAVPPPNPNDVTSFRFRYEFTVATHRTFLVELIDYSGELIDPELNENDLSRRLREHMLTMDGILVLAEAPHPDKPLNPAFQELRRLSQAFALLRGEKQDGPALDTPVALLINKWDRRTDAARFSHADADREVRDFFDTEPQPPHRHLADTLRGSVLDGLFRTFPVSAFGCHLPACDDAAETDGRPERPAAVNPLYSFGLKDGFVWACRERDRLDLKEFESLVERQVWWRPWQLTQLVGPHSLFHKGSDLRKRFPAGSPEEVRAGVGLASARKFALGLSAFVVFAVIVGWLSTFTLRDYLNYRTHKPTFLALADAERSRVEAAEEWLSDYTRNRQLSHVGYRAFYDSGSADIQLVKTRSRLQELDAVRPAYENRTALDEAEAAFDKLLAAASEDEPDYDKLRQRLAAPPHPEYESKELAERRSALAKKIGMRVLEIGWPTFAQKYEELVAKQDLIVVALHLASRKLQTSELARLKADFSRKARARLESTVKRSGEDRQWDEARAILKKVRDDANCRSVLLGSMSFVEELLSAIDEAEDKYLYERVENPKTRTPGTVQKYLKDAPVKAMQPQVEKYQQYASDMEGKLEVEIGAVVVWGTDCWQNARNTVKITIDNTDLFFEKEVKSNRDNPSDLAKKTCGRKLADPVAVNVAVGVTSGNFVFSNRDHGQGSFEGRFGDLLGEGKAIELNKFGNKVVLKIVSGIPEEPPLPPWRK